VNEVISNEFMAEKQKPTDTFLITKTFRTPAEFSLYVEQTAFRTGQPCMDVLLDFCMKHEIEAESVNKIINNSLRAKLEAEAQDLNLLKVKGNKLPF
jgi:hypothetical protein